MDNLHRTREPNEVNLSAMLGQGLFPAPYFFVLTYVEFMFINLTNCYYPAKLKNQCYLKTEEG